MTETTEKKAVLTSGGLVPLRRSASPLALLASTMMTLACAGNLSKSQAARLSTIQQSPQWRDGAFKNTLPREESSIWSMLNKAISTSAETAPDEPLPVVERDKAGFSIAPASGLRVTWLGHSSVLIEIDGHRVLTDPMWSDRASPFSWVGPKRFFAPPLPLDEMPKLDAVAISHDHFDHLDQRTIERLKDSVPLFAVPLGVGEHLEAWGVEPNRIAELDWWGELQVGGLTLTATPARHFSGRSLTDLYENRTLWAGWSIAGPTHRVFFSGDTAMFPGFVEIGERLGPFDITLMETGAYDALWADVHLGPEQAVLAHRMVRGKLMLPVHWGTFDLANHSWVEPVERANVAAEAAGVALAVPKPGQSIEPSAPPAFARWWPEVKWQTVQQAPVFSSGLKPSAIEARTTEALPAFGFQSYRVAATHPLGIGEADVLVRE